ncbi:MAG: glycosyltransferase family 2 protein [Actinomycetota bacterium]|nr:glycosyltransferase family 2 protein [Actinomycetota bacterium]
MLDQRAGVDLSVAVIVPIRNERRRLPELLQAIEDQTLRPDEVVIVDGRSTDGSRSWLHAAMHSRPWLRLIDNPTRVIPDALNRGVQATSADIVARMDAHAMYDCDYLEQLVDVLAIHSEVAGAGGAMRTTGSGPWGSAIASVLRRPWGLGGAPHRVGGVGGPVDHTFCTAYRRSAVLAVGGWDRHLLANEDVELDFRVAATEGPIWLVPQAGSTWRTRETPGALVRQMWRYGYYRARTAHLHPRTLKARHLVPVVVVTAIPALGLLRPRWGAALAFSYVVGATGMGALGARRDHASGLRGGIVVPVVHVAWGAGMVVGLVRHVGARSAPGLPPLGYR